MILVRAETDFDHLRRNAHAWAVLLAWGKTGLLDALADGAPRSASELPGDARSIAITAPILGHMGLLVRHPRDGGDAWALSRTARDLLEQGVLRIGAPDWSALGDLTRLDLVLARGGPVPDEDGNPRVTRGGVVETDTTASRRFMDMLYRRSAGAAEETARAIAARAKPGRALDLGGGHGRYGHELAKVGFEVTLYDRPVCVGIARERFGDALAYSEGDFTTDDLGGPYDVVLLSNIVHGLSPDELRGLLPRLRAVTAPGGLLALKDMFTDDTGIGPEAAVMFALLMLMHTEAGQSYAVGELGRWAGEAGWGPIEHLALPDLGFAILFARPAG